MPVLTPASLPAVAAHSSEKERLMLLMRAEKAEARIGAVENQLTKNSKKFAKEISGLKMKLMEKDAAIAQLHK